MKRVYKHLFDPEKYPEFEKRAAKAITRSALGAEIQFTSARGFSLDGVDYTQIADQVDSTEGSTYVKGMKISYLEETMDMYVNHFKLGKIFWPEYPTLFVENFNELVDCCKRNGLYLFDFWGFVPSGKPAESRWGEYKIPEAADKYMRAQLGDHFLGYDSGEQDGRYVCGYAARMSPVLGSRKEQYKCYQAHFEKLNDTMLNHTVTLAGLTFLHYFAKEGNSIMLGAETAQALPNNNMWFAFIRGASKQYGLLNYGCVSIFNRWGYKDYNTYIDTADDTAVDYSHTPMSGTSLSLMRRLMYNQYMYNCDALGYEGNWFAISPATPEDKTDEKNYVIGKEKYTLTPIGEIQQKCGEFVRKHGVPGVMYTPLAIVADFHSGWVPPRHLYASSSGDIYKVWGNLPYNVGDHQLDLIFDTLFPNYDCSGWYRNELGFETETPYGEIADVLLSDVREEILGRYTAAIVLNDTVMTLELFKKLKSYVSGGGKLLVFEGLVNSGLDVASYDEDYVKLFGVGDDTNAPSRVVNFGQGSVTVVQEDSGLVKLLDAPEYQTGVETPLIRHYDFSDNAKAILDNFISPLAIIRPNNKKLQYCLNIKSESEYVLFVSNNTLSTETFDIEACEGKITEVIPMPIEDSVRDLPEFLPSGFVDTMSPGYKDGAYTIGAGDCLIFTVKTEGVELLELEESYPTAAKGNLYLAKGYSNQPAKEFLLDTPTFSHHFDGMVIPAEYFERISDEAAEKEAHYFKLQGVKVSVDFTKLLNIYPDISIVGNFKTRSEEAVRRVERTVRLASYYGCEFAIFTCTDNAECHWSDEDAAVGTTESLKSFKAICDKYGVKCILQNRHLKNLPTKDQYDIARKAGLSLGYNTVYSACSRSKDGAAMPDECELLMLAAPYRDEFGQLYRIFEPCALSTSEEEKENVKVAYSIALSKGLPVVLSADFKDWNEVIAELDFLG